MGCTIQKRKTSISREKANVLYSELLPRILPLEQEKQEKVEEMLAARQAADRRVQGALRVPKALSPGYWWPLEPLPSLWVSEYGNPTTSLPE